MKQSQYWQNFELGTELEIASEFIYNGLNSLHKMEMFYYDSEIFNILYNLSVGLERFLKVAVVLLEYDEKTVPSEYEKTLITHNHLDLIKRIKKYKKLNLGKVHNDLLNLLSRFYKSYRYDRYSIRTVEDSSKEKRALFEWLEKYLNIDVRENLSFKPVRNEWRIKKFVGKIVGKIVNSLYVIIEDAARFKNIYTYEIRYLSKAYKLLYEKKYNFEAEDILWKELVIFLINTDQDSQWLDFIREIDPLNFDIGLISEYLQSLGNDMKKLEIMEELHSLYDDVEKKGERIQKVNIIGDPDVYLD